MDLGAVNFLHWEKPKVWYVVGGEEGERLQKKIEESMSNQNKPFDNIMRHKDYFVTREFLSMNSINYSVIQQNAGEFVVMFPRGFHQGFNLGLNFAEATNYGTDNWVKFGQKAVQCSCGKTPQIFNMDVFKK